MPVEIPTIPRHEPEVVAATADRKWGGDVSRAATTSLDSLIVNGIVLTSRYARAEEYAAMAAIVSELPARIALEINAIHCDSRVGWGFQVTLGDWAIDLATAVVRAIESACLSRIGGHGGLWVVPEAALGIRECMDVDGRWLSGT